jgi:hypothetical protein
MNKKYMVYQDPQKQNCFENACDCLKYGYGFSYLNTCGLDVVEARKIWKKAIEVMSKL